MNILILDYLPIAFCVLTIVYFTIQTVLWVERGRLRWIVYGLFACLGVLAFFVAQIQLEALQEYDQVVEMSADCVTDWECAQGR